MQLITILYYSMYLVLTAYKPESQASEPCPYDCFQKAAIRWQKGRMGVPKLEPTLPAAQRMAAAKAVLSSLPPDQLLKVLIIIAMLVMKIIIITIVKPLSSP